MRKRSQAEERRLLARNIHECNEWTRKHPVHSHSLPRKFWTRLKLRCKKRMGEYDVLPQELRNMRKDIG